MPKVTSCSVETSKVVSASHFQNLGLKSHFLGVCRFSVQRIPYIPRFLLDLQPLPVCLTPPQCRGGSRPEASAVGWDVSALLLPWGNRGPLPLSSPIDVGSLHVAQAAGLRAAQQEHVGLEEQKEGRERPVEPLLAEIPPPTTPPRHAASPKAPLTGTKLSLRRRMTSPTQMSRHFCQRKLQENYRGYFYPRGSGGTGAVAVSVLCVRPSFLREWGLQTVGSSATMVASHLHDQRTAKHRGRHKYPFVTSVSPLPVGGRGLQPPGHRWEMLVLPWTRV